MVTLFKVVLNDLKILRYSWYCDKCSETTVTCDVGKGHYKAEDIWPTHTPTSKLCPQCGNWASFISANLIPFWTREDTQEELFKITNYPGACYHDKAGVRDSVTKEIRFGLDQQCLIIILPNNTKWLIDSRSSACSRRSDDRHRCWVRTGSIEEGTLTVTKSGNTCGGVSEYILADGIFYTLTNNQLIEVSDHDQGSC
jgi:hypothetical protein